jgi:hypothetical protein
MFDIDPNAAPSSSMADSLALDGLSQLLGLARSTMGDLGRQVASDMVR